MTKSHTLTAQIDQQLNVIRTWLAPAVDDQMARPDAAKLRVLVNNLVEIRDRIAATEEGLTVDGALSATLETLSDIFAEQPGGLTLTGREVGEHVALFSHMAATAWSYELSARLRGGLCLPEDLAVLRLAKTLHGKGVMARMPEAARDGAPSGGDAA